MHAPCYSYKLRTQRYYTNVCYYSTMYYCASASTCYAYGQTYNLNNRQNLCSHVGICTLRYVRSDALANSNVTTRRRRLRRLGLRIGYYSYIRLLQIKFRSERSNERTYLRKPPQNKSFTTSRRYTQLCNYVFRACTQIR